METAPRNETSFPLHETVESGNLEVLNTLLDNGGDINVENDNGDTLLHVAVNNNNHQSQELVTLLLERGANPQLRNIHGKTPLILATHSLLSNNKPNYGVYYNVANQLLMHGADANSEDHDRNTPLHMAHNVECVRLLLDKGALVNSRNIFGMTPLHEAIGVSYDVANELLMHRADVNSKDSDGNTPLHMACKVECVRLLLDKGALVNSQDDMGWTPLHNAVGGSYDIANELLMHGADVNSKDNDGNTPLHMACDVECVRLLLDKGALVNSRNINGKTPLHMLSMFDRDKAYELLLHGAEVNSKDNYGNTPLHTICQKIAQFNGQDQLGFYCFENTRYITNCMLDFGASLTTKNNIGRTPSDIFSDLLDWAKPYYVRKACIKLSDIPHEELDLKYYWISCLKEATRLKLVRFGKNSLYDIFGQYSDPIFLSNEQLKKAVDINNCKKEFPIYCYLLHSTYKLAEKRLSILEDAVDTLQTPLPREITWYILTFVDDDSLRNVIRAKDAKQLVEIKGHK